MKCSRTGVQSDLHKMRRIPWYIAFAAVSGAAVVCTVGPPLALFAAELGLDNDQIGLLGGIMPFLQVAGLLAIPLIAWFGVRTVSVFAQTARFVFLALLLVTPFVADQPDKVFVLLLVAMLGFSLLRAVAEAAVLPWSQEFQPPQSRGLIAGRIALFYVPVALIVSWLIQLWLDSQEGLWRFYPVFVIGILLGIVGGLCLLGLGGGRRLTVAPHSDFATGVQTLKTSLAALTEPLLDRNFLVFLAASSLQYVVICSSSLFLLIFFRDLGVASGTLVLLSALISIGSAPGMMVAGWLLDRYGTRPVYVLLMTGQAALFLALPLISAETPGLLPVAAAVFLLCGLFLNPALAVAGIYLLNVVPPDAKVAYTNIHYITVGLVAGAATSAAGFLLALLASHPVSLGDIAVEPFAAFFLLAAILSVLSGLAFHRLREEHGLSVRGFLANFTKGQPIRALMGIKQITGETSEELRRQTAYALGSFGSSLAKKELIEALRDPSFEVRLEAVRALGQLPPHDDVVVALTRMLSLDGLIELQHSSLESLGRIRATTAAPLVAGFLDHPNPLLRARAIRSLGEMQAREHIFRLRAFLSGEHDVDCRLAAVSALGRMGDADSFPMLLDFYRSLADGSDGTGEPRSKVVLLALARIMGCDQSFAHFWTHEQQIPGQVAADLLKRLSRLIAPLCRARAEDLSAAADKHASDFSGAAWCGLLACEPLLGASNHGSAPLVSRLLKGVADIEIPHPALLVLVILGLRQTLRRSRGTDEKLSRTVLRKAEGSGL